MNERATHREAAEPHRQTGESAKEGPEPVAEQYEDVRHRNIWAFFANTAYLWGVIVVLLVLLAYLMWW